MEDAPLPPLLLLPLLVADVIVSIISGAIKIPADGGETEGSFG